MADRNHLLHARQLRFEPLEDRRVLSITVDTLVDENNGVGVGTGTSLREAIAAAAAGDTIDFSVTGTINLTVGTSNTTKHLLIDKNLTITGPGTNLLTIKAFDPTPATKNGDGSRVFTIDNGNSSTLVDISLSGLTLTGGDTATAGGAVSTSENLTVTDCVVTGNTTTLANLIDGGGGIFSNAGSIQPNSLTVRGTTFSNNTAPGSEGAGLRKRFGSLLVEDSTFSNNIALNAGGGISSSDGNIAVQINRSTFSGNKTTYTLQFGGSAVFGFGADFTIADCAISGNTAASSGAISTRNSTVNVSNTVLSGNTAVWAGAIYTLRGALSVDNCTLTGNTASASTGGAIVTRSASLQVANSLVSGNSATKGGGIWHYGPATDPLTALVTNSTISGNVASVAGGAVYNSGGPMTIRHSTITANTAPASGGGGLVATFDKLGAISVLSSIVSANAGDDVAYVGAENLLGSIGYNLVGNGNGIASFNASGDQTGVTNPMLGPLADNGGTTKTHQPLTGSPAIDAGDPAAAGASFFDQRGTPYVRVYDGDGTGGGRIDIGAVEVQTQPLPAAVFGDFNSDGFVDAADYVVWRKTQGTTLTPYTGADGTGDGSVGAEDYTVWRSRFGTSVPAPLPSAAASVNAFLVEKAAATTTTDDRVFELLDPLMSVNRPHVAPKQTARQGAAGTSTAARDLALIALLDSGRDATSSEAEVASFADKINNDSVDGSEAPHFLSRAFKSDDAALASQAEGLAS